MVKYDDSVSREMMDAVDGVRRFAEVNGLNVCDRDAVTVFIVENFSLDFSDATFIADKFYHQQTFGVNV